MSEIKIDPEQLKKLADVYQQAEDEAENTLKELKWDTSELMLTLTLSSTGRIRDLQSELNHSIETYRQKVDETQEAVMIARAAIQSADRSMAEHLGVFALELVSYYDIQRINPENEFDPITGEKLSDFDRDLALLMLVLTLAPPAKALGIAAKMGIKGVKTYLVREGAYLIRSAKNVMNPKVLKQMGKMALAAIIAGPIAKTAQGLKTLIKDMKEIGNTLKYIGGNLEDKLEFETIGPDIIEETANSKSAKEIMEMIKDNVLSNIEKAKETLVRFGGKGKGKSTGKVYPTRQIDAVAEAHIIDRVKELRGRLSSRYKKSGNFAVAEVDVNNLNKKEFYASSKIDEYKGDLKEKVPDISLKPKEPIFEASLAPGKDGKTFMRDSDTEYKILNEIALKLGDDVNATGKIKLFTELDTCDSCSKVIAEFANKYKNIELEVIHNSGERIKP